MADDKKDVAGSDLPLVDKDYLLVKQAGKGGWTYLIISEIPPDRRAKFGWVKVKGTIDSYALNGYRLMPMGNGKLFLPVKAEIRKLIRKKEGDFVHLTLFADNAPTEVPQEIWLCLEDHPSAATAFRNLSEEEKRTFVDWIYGARTDETKVERIVRMITLLEKGKKFADR
jgi:hypothetical protein